MKTNKLAVLGCLVIGLGSFTVACGESGNEPPPGDSDSDAGADKPAGDPIARLIEALDGVSDVSYPVTSRRLRFASTILKWI